MADFLSGFQTVVGLTHVANEQQRLGAYQQHVAGQLTAEDAKAKREFGQQLLETRKAMRADPSMPPTKLMDLDNQLFQLVGMKPLDPTQYFEHQQTVNEAVDAYARGDMATVGRLIQQLPAEAWKSLKEQAEAQQAVQASAGREELVRKANPEIQNVPGVAAAVGESPALQKQVGEAVFPPEGGIEAERVANIKARTARIQMERGLLNKMAELSPTYLQRDANVASAFAGVQKIRKGHDDLDALRKANPTLAEFDKTKDARMQAVDINIKQLEDQQWKLSIMQDDAEAGAPLPPGYDKQRVEAEAAVTEKQIGLKKAEETWLREQTPASFQAYQKTHGEVKQYLQDLRKEGQSLGQQTLELKQARFAVTKAKDYQKMYEDFIKAAALATGEDVGSVSMQFGEGGAISHLQVGGTIKDPKKLGLELEARLKEIRFLPPDVRAPLEKLAARYKAGEQANKPPTKPEVDEKKLREKYGLPGQTKP